MKILLPTSITLDEEKLGLEPGDIVRHYNPTSLSPRKIPMPKF